MLALAAMYVGVPYAPIAPSYSPAVTRLTARSASLPRRCGRGWCSPTTARRSSGAREPASATGAEVVTVTPAPTVATDAASRRCSARPATRAVDDAHARVAADTHREDALHVRIDRLAEGRHQHAADAVRQSGADSHGDGVPRRRAAGAVRLAAVEPHVRRQPQLRPRRSTTAARCTSTTARRRRRASRRPSPTCARSRRPRTSTCRAATSCCCRRFAPTRAFCRHFFSRAADAVLRRGRAAARRSPTRSRSSPSTPAASASRGSPGSARPRPRRLRCAPGAMPAPVAGRIGVPVPGVELKVVPVGDAARSARPRSEHHARLLARSRTLTARPFDERGLLPDGRRDRPGRSATTRRAGSRSRGGSPRTSSCRPAPGCASGRCARRLLAHLGDLAQDVVIAGARSRRRRACSCSRTSRRAATSPGRRGRRRCRRRARARRGARRFADALVAFSAAQAGSSTRVGRGAAARRSRRRSTRRRSPTRARSIRGPCCGTGAALVEQLYGAPGRRASMIDIVRRDDRHDPCRSSSTTLDGHRRARAPRGARRRHGGRRWPRASTSARAARRDPQGLADYYRSRKMACVVFSVDERLSGRPQLSNDEVADFAAANADVAIAFASIDPHRGADGVREAQPAGVGRARPRPEAASAAAAVLAERSHGVSALRGLRRGEAAGALSHRPQRHRHRHAGRRRHPPEVRQPDADRRRGGGLSGDADHPGASVVPVAGRSDLDLPAQADGLHRSVRLVAEVLLADAGAVREHAAQAQGAVRIGLPADHAGSVAGRLREDGDPRRGAAAHPEENAIKLFGLPG